MERLGEAAHDGDKRKDCHIAAKSETRDDGQRGGQKRAKAGPEASRHGAQEAPTESRQVRAKMYRERYRFRRLQRPGGLGTAGSSASTAVHVIGRCKPANPRYSAKTKALSARTSPTQRAHLPQGHGAHSSVRRRGSCEGHPRTPASAPSADTRTGGGQRYRSADRGLEKLRRTVWQGGLRRRGWVPRARASVQCRPRRSSSRVDSHEAGTSALYGDSRGRWSRALHVLEWRGSCPGAGRETSKTDLARRGRTPVKYGC